MAAAVVGGMHLKRNGEWLLGFRTSNDGAIVPRLAVPSGNIGRLYWSRIVLVIPKVGEISRKRRGG